MIVAAFMVGNSVGAAAMIVTAGVIALTRYLSLGTVAGAVVYTMVSVLAVDDSLLLRLALMTAGLVLLRHIPAMIRLVRRAEPRLSLKEDITYKLDE
jgi:glycerol-3-phosphate acyltransferase PlsY